MTRRHQPYDPAKAERDAEKRRLVAMGAQLVLDRGGKVVSARLSNVFNLLLQRQTITADHYDAAYTLANEWAAWKGLDGGPEPKLEHVGGSSALDPAETCFIAAQCRVAHGEAVERALGAVEGGARAVLEALMVATVEEDRGMSWRGVVERVCGVKVLEKQTVIVVTALEGLRRAYQEPKRAAA